MRGHVRMESALSLDLKREDAQSKPSPLIRNRNRSEPFILL